MQTYLLKWVVLIRLMNNEAHLGKFLILSAIGLNIDNEPRVKLVPLVHRVGESTQTSLF